MWSLPSRSLATASFIALLVVAQTSRLSGSASPPSDPPQGVNLIQNGGFEGGMSNWHVFATPNSSYIFTQTTNGFLEFYRIPGTPGERPNQAVVLQATWTQLPAQAPILATFELGNSSNVRKRVKVLAVDLDFSDLHGCSFWLEPNTPLRPYRMLTHTTRPWANSVIGFYASTPDSDGGYYQVDNVTFMHAASGPTDRTICEDPTAPAATSASDGPEMLVNGDFSDGLFHWAGLHRITYQLNNGVFEFIWPPAEEVSTMPSLPDPGLAPVLIQRTQQAVSAGEILTAKADFGNTSNVRKRVLMLIHQWDFSDMTACTFWLEPNTPLRTYTIRGFATTNWTDAAFSAYTATQGPETWVQVDNASLKRTPGRSTAGTECLEFDEDVDVAPGANAPSVIKGRSAATRIRSAQATPTRSRVFDRSRRTASLADVSAVPASSAGTAPMGTSSQRGQLSYLLPPGDDLREIQISTDREEWHTVRVVEPSDDWLRLTLDLSDFGGQIVFVRVRGF